MPLIGLQAGVGSFSNGSGGDLAAGAVVVRDPTSNSRFTTTTSEGDTGFLGVLVDFISNTNSGRVLLDGIIVMDVSGAVTRGQFLKTSTLAGAALGTNTYGQGVFGVALDASAGGQVKALVFRVERSPGSIPHDIFDDHDVALAVTDAGGTTVNFEAGQLWVGGTFFGVSSGSIGVTDNDTTFVFVNAAGAVAVNTSGFPADGMPLAEVVASGGSISAVNDRRGYLSGRLDHGILAGLGDDDHSQYVKHSILTTTGDIFIASSNGVAGRLAVGSANQVIGVSGGLPFWTAQSYLDHGAIGGLGDDDHTQYALDSEVQSVDFLVGTASGYLSGEIIVGTTPGGELGNTWASPTVDATHSGSAHHALSHALASHTALDHDVLAGLGDDDHSIYALLAGRGTGQTLIGGVNAGNDLTLQSTAHATRGIIFTPDNMTIAGGTLLLGVHDDVRGLLTLAGRGTGQAAGGTIQLYMAADHDSVDQFWGIDISADDLRIFPSGAAFVNRFTAEGQLQLPMTGSAGGIIIGGDVLLYRSGADTLTIADSVRIIPASGNALLNLEGTATRIRMKDTDNADENFEITSSAGNLNFSEIDDSFVFVSTPFQLQAGTPTLAMVLGSAGQLLLSVTGSAGGVRIGGDVDIYRSAANMLYTPDSMTIAVSLLVDTIIEFTPAAGVIIEGTRHEDNDIYTTDLFGRDRGHEGIGYGSRIDLTYAGGPQTDLSRILAVEGDGIPPPDSSVGVWEATTNLIPNGGLETNTTGWGARGGSIARVSTLAKFGSNSLRCITGTGTFGGLDSPVAVMAAETEITVSFWIYRTEGAVPIHLFVRDESGNFIETSGAIPTTVGRWFRFEFTTTTLSGDTGAVARITKSNDATDVTFYIDGLQIEAQPIATPYVETDGGTAARSIGEVAVTDTSLLGTETQGWVAFRVRTGWLSSKAPFSFPEFFSWGIWPDRIIVYYNPAGGQEEFEISRTASGVQDIADAGAPFVKGDFVTVVAYWTLTELGMSVNGGAFQKDTTAQHIPDLSGETQFQIGKAKTSASVADSDYLWFASGKGVLTDADAEVIASVGNNDPPADLFSTTAELAFLWHARTRTASPDVVIDDPDGFYVDFVEGTVIMEERATEPTTPPATRLTYFPWNVGGHTRPTWKDGDGDLYAAPREAMVVLPRPLDGTGAIVSGGTPLSASTSEVCIVNIPTPITIDELQWNAGGGGADADNVVRIAMYSEDGQTKIFDVTDALGTATGIRTVSVGPVFVAPGNYYVFICLSSGTEPGPTLDRYLTGGTFVAGGAGENDLGGDLTISGGTAPTTFDPTAITTPGDSRCVVLRFDGTVG